MERIISERGSIPVWQEQWGPYSVEISRQAVASNNSALRINNVASIPDIEEQNERASKFLNDCLLEERGEQKPVASLAFVYRKTKDRSIHALVVIDFLSLHDAHYESLIPLLEEAISQKIGRIEDVWSFIKADYNYVTTSKSWPKSGTNAEEAPFLIYTSFRKSKKCKDPELVQTRLRIERECKNPTEEA